MSIYTMIEKGKDADGLVLHDVKRDGIMILADAGYSAVLQLVEHEIKPGDIYQECVGDSAPYCIQTYDRFQDEVELSRKFGAGEA